MTTHAPLSPSARSRWSKCPGSVAKESQYENKSGPSAIDGTHTHTMLEHCLKNQIDPLLLVGTDMRDDDGAFTIDIERARRVGVTLDYVLEKTKGGGYTVLSETKVNPARALGRTDMFGTVDIQIIGNKTLEIVDHKDGIGIVVAEGNLQLEQYAIGALCELPKEHKDVEKVIMTISQPKNALKGLPMITSWELSVTELLDLERVGKIIKEASATDNPDAPLVPGESQCKFCKHAGACTALAAESLNAIGVSFPDVSITEPKNIVEQIAQTDAKKLTNEDIQMVLESSPLIRGFIEAVEEEAMARFKSGSVIPGFKVVNGRGSREWKTSEEDMIKRLGRMGIPKSSTYISSFVSPSQVERLSWVKKDGSRHQLSKKQIEMLNKEYVNKKSGKPMIAPESDDRVAIVLNAAPMFPVISEPSLPGWMA